MRRFRQTGKLRHRRRLQRGKAPPSKGTLIERNGSAVRLDRCLDGVLGNGHETGLPGIAEHKDVRGHAVAKKRSEEHTSELQSLMRISYAVFCLKKQNPIQLLEVSEYLLYLNHVTPTHNEAPDTT